MGNVLDRARFGPFEVDLHTHELWKFGTRIKLVGQPFEILAVLLRRTGELVTRDELRTRLWPADTFVDFNHGLNAAVNKLREALSDSADDPRYIETLPRRGYRFIAKVEWVDPAQSRQTNAAAKIPSPDVNALPSDPIRPAPAPILQAAETRPHSYSRFSLAVISVAGIFLLVLFFAIARYAHIPASSASVPVQRMRPLLPIAETYTHAFSPDGNFVAFYSEHSAGPQPGIYVSAVGSNQYLQLSNSDDDCCPVWSPDGRWIAFTRSHNHEYSIFLVPSDGGGDEKLKAEKALTTQSGSFKLTSAMTVERKLDTGSVIPQRPEIDWSPDGKSILFSSSGLYLADVQGPRLRRLTETPPSSEDWGGQFSSDGNRVLFVRTHQIGTPDEIYTVPVAGGDPTRVLSELGKIDSVPQWSYDGRSVIFSSNRTGHTSLWRASLDSLNSVIAISEAGSPAWGPVVARRGYRFAYERVFRSLSIWQMDVADSDGKRPYLLVPSTSDTDQGPGPQFSPDGKKLAYMSDHNGTMEIWVANRDGSNPFQLSAVGTAGTPRWSPDSQAVVFDVATPEGSKIVTMTLQGGPPQILTPDKTHNVCPSWSHDGKWVYFGSSRSGSWQVWKVPSTGGTPVQITQHGGHAALESLDRKYIYYSKTPNPEPEIWRVPIDGGEEKLMPIVRPGTWASWQVVEGGILFVGPSLGHQAALSFYDAAKDRTTTMALLDKIPFWLGVSADGKSVAFDQPGREQAQAMLIENFH